VTRRLVGVLATRAAFPTGELRAAMAEDAYETVAGLELVEAVLVVEAADPDADTLAALTWPGTEVVRLSAPGAMAALGAMAELGADQVTVVAADAPDLPGLLVGKLHRGLGSADVAVLPSTGGGLVALAAPAPVPDWVSATVVGLDTPDAVARLREAAPRRTAVSVGPGWHRVRSAADLESLDPGLEGWEVTRAVLSTSRRPGPG
jgi:hypothetical protein